MTFNKDAALVIGPRVTATLSMIGSLLIIIEVLQSKEKRSKVYHRLLLGLSVIDFITSICFALATLPMPPEFGMWGSKGNDLTCNIQGTFIQFSIASPLYNTMLAIYYMLIIRYNWKDIRIKKLEKFFHSFPISFGSITALLALGLGLYSPATFWCWINSVPATCKGSARNNGVNDCESGNNAWIYRWALYYAPLWTTILISVLIMFLIFIHVRKVENKSLKYKFRSKANSSPSASTSRSSFFYLFSRKGDFSKEENPTQRRKSNRTKSNRRKSQASYTTRVAHQAYFFLGAYFITWTPVTLVRLLQIFGRSYYGLNLVASIITPCQGLLNYIVYHRPRYISCKKKHPEWNFFQTFLFVFFPHSLKIFFKASFSKQGKSGKSGNDEEGGDNPKSIRKGQTSKHSNQDSPELIETKDDKVIECDTKNSIKLSELVNEQNEDDDDSSDAKDSRMSDAERHAKNSFLMMS